MLRGCGHRAYAIGAFLPLLHTVTILQECHTPSFVKISQIHETCRETQFAISLQSHTQSIVPSQDNMGRNVATIFIEKIVRSPDQNRVAICSNRVARQPNHATHPSKWTMRRILLMA